MSEIIDKWKERRENRILGRKNRKDDEEFESKHPRGHGGKFAKKGSGNITNSGKGNINTRGEYKTMKGHLGIIKKTMKEYVDRVANDPDWRRSTQEFADAISTASYILDGNVIYSAVDKDGRGVQLVPSYHPSYLGGEDKPKDIDDTLFQCYVEGDDGNYHQSEEEMYPIDIALRLNGGDIDPSSFSMEYDDGSWGVGETISNANKREKKSRIQAPLRKAIRQGDTKAISSLLDKMKPGESIVDPINPKEGISNTFIKNKDGSFTLKSKNPDWDGKTYSSSMSHEELVRMFGKDPFPPKYKTRGKSETTASQKEE